MKLRAALERGFLEGLKAVDLEQRTRTAVLRVSGLRDEVHVLAIGKGGAAMFAGAATALGDRMRRALVVIPDGVDVRIDDARVDLVRSSHPVPDRRSLAAGERALEFARAARQGVLVALVSGGASALVCAPSAGVTLADQVAALADLTSAGATIAELNVVRRHLSRIKGGGIARACAPGRIVSIVASDVIGGAAWDVGSGPTLVDPTTRADARAVLRRYGLVAPRLHETLDSATAGRRVGRARLIASPATLADEVARSLARAPLDVSTRPPRTREIEWFVREYAALAAALPRGSAVVRAAEPTLVFDARRAGRGGRCGHLAAALSIHLPRGVSFLAAASDGVDGSSRSAGAVVDDRFVASVGVATIERALSSFATAPLHDRAGTSLRMGPTGHNLCDIHILARAT